MENVYKMAHVFFHQASEPVLIQQKLIHKLTLSIYFIHFQYILALNLILITEGEVIELPKFYNNVLLFVGLTFLGTFIEF